MREKHLMRRLISVALLAALLMSLCCAQADGNGAESLSPCVSRGDDPNHEHIYPDTEWLNRVTPHTHSAHCAYPGCTRMERVLCNEINVETGNGEVAVCPVCGAITRGDERIAQAEIAATAQVTDSASPGEWHGDPLVRLVQLDEQTVMLTVAYVCHGACQPHDMDVRVSLTEADAALLDGYSLMMLGGAQDMNLSFTRSEDASIVTMRFARRPAAVLIFSK